MISRTVRAERAAKRMPNGEQIWEFLGGPSGRTALVDAAEKGQPPVGAISAQLIEIAGLKALDDTKMKQFVGMCVRAIMEEEGYALADTGVWLGNDPLFSTGATYRRASKPGSGTAADFLERFVAALTMAEAEELSALLSRRLKSSR